MMRPNASLWMMDKFIRATAVRRGWLELENSVIFFSPLVQDHNPKYNQGVFSNPSQKEDEYRAFQSSTEKKNTTNADQMHSIQTSPFHLDDSVLVNQLRHKISQPFDLKPCTVIQRKGSMLTSECDGHQTTQNSLFFKHVHTNVTPLKNPVESVDDNQTPW